MSLTQTNPSYHARNKFRDRIADDPTLIESCWYGGVEVEAPKRDYDVARLYEGPLCTDCIMFAVESATNDCDWMIRTVLPAAEVDYEVAA